jgi:hypothetical protein
MMITTINLPRLRAAEFIQFHSNVFQIIEANDPPALKVDVQLTALEAALAALDAEYKRQTSSAITLTLAQLDERRDNAFTGIQRVVSGYELHFDAAKVTAARRITLVFNKYGSGVTRLRYQQETGEIRSLGADLTGDAEVAAAVTALGLGAWVAELNAANAAFDEAYVQRSRETAGDPSQVLALRVVLAEKWETLKAHLTAHATLTPSAVYTKTIAELNSLIDDYNNATVSRTAEEPVPTPSPTPAPAP